MTGSDAQLTESQRLAHDLSRNIAVAAGAGTGKTRVLTSRYLWTLEKQLAAEGKLRPERIVALTFTDKAAAEMRGRIQRQLFARSQDPRWASGLKSLERSPICTIHAYCMLILRQYAVEAGLDTSFDIIDNVRRWRLTNETVEGLFAELAADTRLQAGQQFASETAMSDIPLGSAIARLAGNFSRNQLSQMLVKMLGQRLRTKSWLAELGGHSALTLVEHWRQLIDAANDKAIARHKMSRKAATVLGDLVAGGALPDGDRLAAAVADVSALATWVLSRFGERGGLGALQRRDLIPLLRRDGKPRSVGRLGAKKNWKGREVELETARAAVDALARLASELLVMGPVDDDAAVLCVVLGRLALEALARYQREKGERGVVDFDDQLESTLTLLRTRPDVLTRVRESFDWLLLDEVQDVSAIQWEILGLLAGEEDLAKATVFAVGDDKQSIYRFRGAEVGVFARIRQMVAASNVDVAESPAIVPGPLGDPGSELTSSVPSASDGLITLAENFRSSAEVINFCNHLFNGIFGDDDDGVGPRPGPLLCRRPDGEERVNPGVDLLLREEVQVAGEEDVNSEANSDPWRELRQEAVDVARYLASGAWSIENEETKLPWQDVAILLRTRTHLQAYEEALRRHRIPFVTLGGVGFFRAQEVQDVVSLLRFLADPRHDLALASVLRSPLGNLSDRALVAISQQKRQTFWLSYSQLVGELSQFGGGAYGLMAQEVEDLEAAQAILGSLLGLAGRVPVVELLERAITRSGAYGAWGAGVNGNLALANVAKLIDLAREQGGDGVEGLFDLAESLHRMVSANQIEGEAEIAEAGNAVRILTIHASKGLEFPLVIVPGLGAKTRATDATLLLDTLESGEQSPSVQVGLKVADPGNDYLRGDCAIRSELIRTCRRRDNAEAKRLLYVACTRARDRLVLSGTYRPKKGGGVTLGTGWLAWVVSLLDLESSLGGRESITLSRQTVDQDGRNFASEFTLLAEDALLDAQPLAQVTGESSDFADVEVDVEVDVDEAITSLLDVERIRAAPPLAVDEETLVHGQRCALQAFFCHREGPSRRRNTEIPAEVCSSVVRWEHGLRFLLRLDDFTVSGHFDAVAYLADSIHAIDVLDDSYANISDVAEIAPKPGAGGQLLRLELHREALRRLWPAQRVGFSVYSRKLGLVPIADLDLQTSPYFSSLVSSSSHEFHHLRDLLGEGGGIDTVSVAHAPCSDCQYRASCPRVQS